MVAIEVILDVVLDFTETDEETLLVFTSDHETGGLALSAGDRTNSTLRALWPTDDHTGVPVPLLATGPGSERFVGSFATRQVGAFLLDILSGGRAQVAQLRGPQ